MKVQDVQAALCGSSSDNLTAGSSLAGSNEEPVFNQLRALSVTIVGDAATVLMQRLRASIMTDLRLSLCCAKDVMDCTPGALLRNLAARFTELRRLRFVLLQFRTAGQLPTAADVLSLRALRSLHELRLHWRSVRGAPLTDKALLDMLQCMPNMRDLSLAFRSGPSSRVVPAIGTVCPLLEQLRLEIWLDMDSLNDYVAKTPCLRHLMMLHVGGLTEPASISTLVPLLFL